MSPVPLPDSAVGDEREIPRVRKPRPLPNFVRLLSTNADRTQYLGRAEICHQVMSLAPEGEDGAAPWVESARRRAHSWFELDEGDEQHWAGGYSWTLVAPNQLTLGIRTVAHPSEEAARADLASVLRNVERLRLVPVHNPTTGHHGTWAMDGEDVVLVSGRMWRRQDASQERALQRLLRRQALLVSQLATV